MNSTLIVVLHFTVTETSPILFTLISTTSGHICHFDVIWCIVFYFPDVGYQQEN